MNKRSHIDIAQHQVVEPKRKKPDTDCGNKPTVLSTKLDVEGPKGTLGHNDQSTTVNEFSDDDNDNDLYYFDVQNNKKYPKEDYYVDDDGKIVKFPTDKEYYIDEFGDRFSKKTHWRDDDGTIYRHRLSDEEWVEFVNDHSSFDNKLEN